MRQDGVIGEIAQQEWMKPAEEGIQNFIHKAFRFKGRRRIFFMEHGSGIRCMSFSRTFRLAPGQRLLPLMHWMRWVIVASTELLRMPHSASA